MRQMTPEERASYELEHDATRQLVAAAHAVVERWDSPLWSKHVHTSELIDDLRLAIKKIEK